MGCRSCRGGHKTQDSPSTILTAEQVILKEKKPLADAEGGLTFEKIAPVMVGYVHDPTNPKRLMPDRVPCTERITLPVLDRDGLTWVMNQCNCIGCPLRGQTVDEEVCGACEFRRVVDKRDKLR